VTTKKKTKMFHLHFIGNSFYSRKSFEREAKTNNIQRALPYTHIKSLSFGETILLGTFIPKDKQFDGKSSVEVFGVLTLTGITHTQFPEEVNRKLREHLNIMTIENSSNNLITRACGSYEIENTAIIDNTLQELCEQIDNALIAEWIHKDKYTEETGDGSVFCTCKKCRPNDGYDEEVYSCIRNYHKCCIKPLRKISPNKFKWFINGQYDPITPFKIFPITFCRSITKVDIDPKFLSLPERRSDEVTLSQIKKYKKRAYMPKHMKDRFTSTLSDVFKGWKL